MALKQRHCVSKQDSSHRQAAWLRQAKRLFPHPLFAFCVSVGFCLSGMLLAGVAIHVEGCWPAWIFSILAFFTSYAAAAAVVTPSEKAPSSASSNLHPETPTFAILAYMIGVYSVLFSIGILVFELFFKNGPGSIKFFVALGISVASSFYMRVHGTQVVRVYFGETRRSRLELSGRQSIYVTIFSMAVGYVVFWLLVVR